MLSQPEVTYFWDEKVLDMLFDSEFKTQLLIEKAKVLEEFETLQKIIQVYP